MSARKLSWDSSCFTRGIGLIGQMCATKAWLLVMIAPWNRRLPVRRRVTRRNILKVGTGAAVAAAVAPMLSTAENAMGKGNVRSTAARENVTPPATENELCFTPAKELATLIREKKVSAREVMQAHLKQIARVNSKVNAIVTLVPEDQLMAQAKAADEAVAKGNWLGPLQGLPVGVKDLHPTKGIRTTFGSPLHA